MDKILHRLYYKLDSPASVCGVQRLYNEAKKQLPKLSVDQVRQWLSTQEPYTLHKPLRHRYQHRKVIVGGIDQQFQIDLCDMQALAKENENNKYILTCIDVFSKYAWAEPVVNKQPTTVALAFEKILQDARIPKSVQSDQGTEFLGRPFQTMLKRYGIKFFTSNNPDIKCSIVERFNRTLKTRMWRAFTRLRNKRWIDILPDLVLGYNASFHRSIQTRPIDVDKTNEAEIWRVLYGNDRRKSKASFNIGQQVRLARKPGTFEKGYEPKWTQEIFVISQILDGNPVMYMVKDADGEEIKGTYYAQELQPCIKEPNGLYWVEKIIRQRRSKRGGGLEYLVKYSGYSAQHNAWIPASDLVSVK